MTVPDWAGYLEWRDRFSDTIDHRRYPIAWLDRQILLGRAQFWRTDKAAIVAEIREYPSGAMDVHGLIAAGDLADIRDTLIPEAEAWGKAVGCIGAVIESREGWGRALRAKGYTPFQSAVRKELR